MEAEVLTPDEFANFQAHLTRQRDMVTRGGTEEPDDELVAILLRTHAISNLATDIHMAAGLIDADPVVLSATARAFGMHLPVSK